MSHSRKKLFSMIALALVLAAGLMVSHGSNLQPVSPDLLSREWPAKWIRVPGESVDGYGIYLFRKHIHLRSVPSAFVIHVSADNRYKLYVNERLVSLGPARGDLFYWNYETVDLAPFLTVGDNIIAAKVWNEGSHRPEAQISWRTGFILQGDTGGEKAVNTDRSWKCIRDDGYRPLEVSGVIGYYVAGPGELIDMKKHIRGWQSTAFDDAAWKNADLAVWSGGAPKGIRDAPGWMLVPSGLPQMELTVQRLQSTREATGIDVPGSFPQKTQPLTFPANTKATLLLDNGFLTNAYVTLQFSRGLDAVISLKYAEALYVPADASRDAAQGSAPVGFSKTAGKGNRDEVKGKIFIGRGDRLLSDGTNRQVFTSLYWRTYRYLQLEIETGDEPLTIEDIYGTFTGYPFRLNSGFRSDSKEFQTILGIGWRTARLCAMETYMDCPYYEQLQYIGDARIQALVSYFNSGDDRLARNALNQMDHSRIAEGVTLSRHPSSSPQIIPTFSLWYIGMLHDYWMYRPDGGFVREKLPGTRQILNFFARYQQADGTLRGVPYWNFTDWVMNRPGWLVGAAPVGKSGESAVLDLQLLLAYQTAAAMENELGMEAYSRLYSQQANRLMETIRDKYWDETKGLVADTAGKDSYSQHANTLAILTGVLSEEQRIPVARKMLSDKSLAPASIYFKYYLHRALIKAGLGDGYLSWLDKWHENIAMGMTTWAEDYDVHSARSDCHAWGSSPNIEFYRTVLGVDSAAPGFSRVRIQPHLGTLRKAGGEIPHPLGNIAVSYERTNRHWEIDISLPEPLAGTLIWENRSYPLNPGKNEIRP